MHYVSGEEPPRSVDVEIAIHLKENNRAFKVEKYEHSYPHCAYGQAYFILPIRFQVH